MRPALVLALLLVATSLTWAENDMIIDFRTAPGAWFRVNDGVMGGLSEGGMQLEEGLPGVFSGRLSLENNGGFASVRTRLPEMDLTAYAGIELKVRGDGRAYQLRFRTDGNFDGAAYRALFPTEAGQWTTVRLPFAAFEPTFRGRILEGYPPLDPARLAQLSFMVADKKAGPFRLEIEQVQAYREDEESGN